jgi:glutamine cyclotransferase
MIEGRLFESVGLYQQSQLRELDPETGEIIDAWMMDSRYFGEGLTYVDGKLIQLTYKRKPLTGFIYNFTDMSAQPSTFNFQTSTGQGWGMTYDSKRKEIVVSDGSDFLLMWDPETMQEKRRVKVTRQLGKSARQINELEYWRDRYVRKLSVAPKCDYSLGPVLSRQVFLRGAAA